MSDDDARTERSADLGLLLAMQHQVQTLDALLDRELAQWHGISAADFRLLLAVSTAPGRALDRSTLASALDVRLIELVKRIRPLQRIGVIAGASDDAQGDITSLPVTLTDAGAALVDSASITANDVASGALRNRWDAAGIASLYALFAATGDPD